MAKESPDWSSSHREAVRAIENELGREICGVFTDSGLPCKKWPVDKSHGRCSEHASRTNNTASPRQVEVTSTSENNSNPVNITTKFEHILRPGVILSLIAGGLLIGLLLTGGLFYYSGDLSASISKVNSPEEPENNSVQNSFTFERMNRLFEAGEYKKLEQNLDQLAKSEEAEKSERALYYLFVLYQRTGRQEKALVAGENFVKNHPEHTRAPEVLYSLVEIAAVVLKKKTKAENYYQRLEREYPDSPWTEKAATFL
ncbi:MAG: tetratricopeptide repeat protein [bacterium]